MHESKTSVRRKKDLSSSWSSHHGTGRGPEHISRYLCNSKFVETNKFIRNHSMKLTLITCKDECEWTHCFSQLYVNHCLRYVFSIVAYQVSRNIVLAPRSVMITIGRLRFHYDNDNEYENEIFVCWHHHFLCSSWVPIRCRCSRRRNGSNESFISLCTRT